MPKLITVAALAALGIYDAVIIFGWMSSGAHPPFADFFAFWSTGKAALAGIDFYDHDALYAEQMRLFPHPFGYYPYPYPPFLVGLLALLALLPLAYAYAVWIAGTFALYVRSAARHWLSALWLLVAPTTLVTVVAGQNGFLSAALLVSGLATRNSVISGILFGLLTYKPQLGIMVPVVLLASRNWTALISAALTVLVMAAAATIVFGPGIWANWIQGLILSSDLLDASSDKLSRWMPTVAAGFRVAGFSSAAALVTQATVALVVSVFVWRAYASGDREKGIFLALIGTALATPYLFVYDLPFFTAALVLKRDVKRWEFLICALVYMSILLMVAMPLPFLVPVLLGALFACQFIDAPVRFRPTEERPKGKAGLDDRPS